MFPEHCLENKQFVLHVGKRTWKLPEKKHLVLPRNLITHTPHLKHPQPRMPRNYLTSSVR